LQNFQLFAKLPTELRLRVGIHALPGPHVWEIEWSGPNHVWQVCPESRPSLPPLHGVNTEARVEFFKTYTAISLVAGPYRPDLPSSGLFFDFDHDILYVAASPSAIMTYDDQVMDELNPIFLDKVEHLAIQGEEFMCSEFDNRPPYNFPTPATQRIASKLATLLARFPRLRVLSVVVGDDFSQALPSSTKPNGLVEFVELTCGRPPTTHWVGAKEQFHAWMKFLLNHNPETYRGSLSINQALRDGNLDVIDVWGFLDHE
ncbi:hypothetical protein N431DRAFT_316575, partial [Stipitochalara longipes BDJ]